MNGVKDLYDFVPSRRKRSGGSSSYPNALNLEGSKRLRARLAASGSLKKPGHSPLVFYIAVMY